MVHGLCALFSVQYGPCHREERVPSSALGIEVGSMNHVEEQTMELEMLQAMFLDDLKVLRAEPPAEFHIVLFPETSAGDENHVAAELHVIYVGLYPEEPPELRVVPKLGLTDELAGEAQSMLRDAASGELLGCAMVWGLAEKLQAWLRTQNAPAVGNMHDEMMARMAGGAGNAGGDGDDDEDGDEDEDEDGEEGSGRRAKKVEVDERNLHATYTPVTPENFLAWRRAFEARMGTSTVVDGNVKPTGRQLCESGKQLAADDEGAVGSTGDDVEDADYTRRAEDEQEQQGPAGAIDESLFDEDEEDEDNDGAS